jgi:hypothetical protein
MRSLIIAAALAFFAIMALAGTSAEPENKPALATASFPDADPVIVNLDTSKPFVRHHHLGRDGLVREPRAFADI